MSVSIQDSRTKARGLFRVHSPRNSSWPPRAFTFGRLVTHTLRAASSRGRTFPKRHGGIPHAHVVVNNTNIETGRRLQDPDPTALASSLQDIAERQGLSAMRPPEPEGVAARAQRRNPRKAPETYRSEYVRRAERELAERGECSWTADIRARVRIARTVARSEAEFRSVLTSMGVTVSDNSCVLSTQDLGCNKSCSPF